jgi:predicted dehydrogenase
VDASPRIGLVGVGEHATTTILPSLRPAGLAVAATCARTLAHAERAAARFGPADAYDELDAMLERSDLDGVVVVLPPSSYAGVVAACIERRLPVFAEKPAAASASEAYEISDLARRRKVPVMVGYMKRFAPSYRRVKELVGDASFGPLSLASFRWAVGRYRGGCSLREWMLENPIHHLDLARFLAGELDDVEVHFARVEDEFVVAVQARSESGAVVSLRLCTTGSWEHESEVVELFGVGSSLEVENVDTLRLRRPSGPEQVWRPNYTVHRLENQSAFVAGFLPALMHFRAVLTDGVDCEPDARDAAATLRLAETIASAAER